MDFRIPGLPHSVVKYAQSTSVRHLIQKIENHPDRHALQRDIRQNESFKTFSPESKQMIRDVGNIELCELLETEPKTQCKVCLSYWNIGILYCTCGHFLHEERGANQQFINYTMDLPSVPEYVIKKGRPHGHRYGARHGRTEEQKEYRVAWNAWKRCCKRVDSRGEHFKGIHDRFLRDQVYRESQLLIGWTEQKCMEMDELAKQDHTYRLSKEDFK